VLTSSLLRRAPKVLLHDHLDGGLRPQTVLELADEHGYRRLPAGDAEGLARWFRDAADSGSLLRYLETFAHTVGVMQYPDAISRVARECALDLAADGVVYAEVRFAPELSTARGLPIEAVVEAILDGFARGSAEAAAAALGELLGRPARAAKLGEAGRRRAEERFSLERARSDFRDLLRAL
jgi:adenosine deaminase